MTNFIAMMTGGFVGYLLCLLFQRADGKDIFGNVILGAVGALVGGRLLAPYFGLTPATDTYFSMPVMLASIAGAVGLVLCLSLFRRNAFR